MDRIKTDPDQQGELFRLAIEAAPTGMMMVDRSGQITMVNVQIEKLFGYDRKELIGQPMEMLVPKRFRPNHPKFRDGFFEDPRTRSMGTGRELFGLRKDESEFPVEIGLNPLTTPQGDFVLSSIVDITERTRAAEQFRLAIEAAPTGMLMVAQDGKIILVNAQIEKLFGYSRAELIGQKVEFLIPSRYRTHHPKFREGFLTDPKSRAMGSGRDLFGLRKDGTEMPIEIGLNPLKTAEGTFVLSSIVDITERKKAEERQNSLREKETLLKEIHHRVKNNLQVISSLLSLQSRHIPDPRSSAMLQESQDRVYSIALVHEKLYQTNNLESISFREYLDALIPHLAETWTGSRSKVTVEVEPDDISLPIDISIPCGLIINELVTNALKHAFPNGDKGLILVSVKQNDDHLTISVKDNGIGMPKGIDVHKPGSLGLELITTLARQLHAQLAVSSSNGTMIEFSFLREEK
jgi:PAS domain S-box-containing protein